jgi:hypothetical protein
VAARPAAGYLQGGAGAGDPVLPLLSASSLMSDELPAAAGLEPCEVVISPGLAAAAVRDEESWDTALRLYCLLTMLPEDGGPPGLAALADALTTEPGEVWEAAVCLYDHGMLSEQDLEDLSTDTLR